MTITVDIRAEIEAELVRRLCCWRLWRHRPAGLPIPRLTKEVQKR